MEKSEPTLRLCFESVVQGFQLVEDLLGGIFVRHRVGDQIKRPKAKQFFIAGSGEFERTGVLSYEVVVQAA